MKKIVLIAAVCAFLISILISCKGTERCPAYGQTETEQADNNA